MVEELGFDLVDLNFECPVRRLLARGEGGALLAEPAEIARLVAAVVRAVSLPVTLKIRSGPDAEHPTAVEVARRAEQAGAAAVSVHARSVAQGYVGGPDWEVVAGVKHAVRIPVIGSGGIRTAAEAIDAWRRSGADAVAIGRGCLGNPWIFRQGRAMLGGGPASARPHAGRAGPCVAAVGRGGVSSLRPCGGPAAAAADQRLFCPLPARCRGLSPTPCGRCKTCRGFAAWSTSISANPPSLIPNPSARRGAGPRGP